MTEQTSLQTENKKLSRSENKARLRQIIKGISVAVILDHVMQQSDTDRRLILHLGGKEKGMEHIGIAALVHILPVCLVHDPARFSYHVRIIH